MVYYIGTTKEVIMYKSTRLTPDYWRYLIRVKGRTLTRRHFHNVLSSSIGMRREVLHRIYEEVFSARA